MRQGEVRQADVNPHSQTAVYRGRNKRIALVSGDAYNTDLEMKFVAAIPRTTTPNPLPAAVVSQAGEAGCDERAVLDCWQLLRVPTSDIKSRFGHLQEQTRSLIGQTIRDCLGAELPLHLKSRYAALSRRTVSFERGTVGILRPPGKAEPKVAVVVSNTFASARSRVMSIVTIAPLEENESAMIGRAEISIPDQGQFEVHEETVRVIDPAYEFQPLRDTRRVPVKLSPQTVDQIVASILNYIDIGA